MVPPARLELANHKAAEPKSAASTSSAKEAGSNLLALCRLSSWGCALLRWSSSDLLRLFLLWLLGFLRTFAHRRVLDLCLKGVDIIPGGSSHRPHANGLAGYAV